MPDQYNANLDLTTIDSGEIYNTIITALEAYVGEPLYPGDERRMFGEAMAAVFTALYNTLNDVARQTLLRHARGAVLDAIGERSGTVRLSGETAATVLRFSLSVPRSTNTIIPQGTKVTGDKVRYFATDEAVVLQSGLLSVDVPASALETGTPYNGYTAGFLNSIVDLVPFVSSVVNLTETAGGDDGEPYTTEGDDHYRERILLSPATQTTAGPAAGYQYWARTADADIVDAAVISEAPGEITVLPLLSGGGIPDEDILQKVFNVVSDPKIRPLTDKVNVRAPGQVPFDIVIHYYTTEADAAQVIQNIEGDDGAIARFIGWQCETLGRDINPDQLRRLILAPGWADALTGAARVDVTEPGFTPVGAAMVAAFSGNLTVTHEMIAG